LEVKYEQLMEMMSKEEVLNNPAELQKCAKAQADLEDIVAAYREYKKVVEELEYSKAMLGEKLDAEMEEMVKMEIKELTEQEEDLKNKLTILLLPKDPNDSKNVIMEIRAGTGGDEAGLFASDLYRMYTRYAENQGWKVEMMNSNYTDVGGFKEVTFMIVGKGAYSKLKFEGGVHRVQRVPATESSGRIHTSAATVAVLPEAEEVEVEINPNDLRIDVFCSSGPGGQSVNTTQSAVRVTHIPTGVVAESQEERSQYKNRENAMRKLRARLYDAQKQAKDAEYAQNRKSQVGSGDRSERIRTYNYPQGRVTDHRINLTLYKLEEIVSGDALGEIIDALVAEDQAQKLAELD